MIITYLAWIIHVYGFYLLYSVYGSLPDQVPIRYDLDGSIKDMGSKDTLFVLVGVGFFTAILMTGLMFSDKAKEASLVLEATHLLTQMLFTYIISQTIRVVKGKAEGLGTEFYYLLFAVILVPVILAMVYH